MYFSHRASCAKNILDSWVCTVHHAGQVVRAGTALFVALSGRLTGAAMMAPAELDLYN